MVCRQHVCQFNDKLRKQLHLLNVGKKKENRLFTGLGSVRMLTNVSSALKMSASALGSIFKTLVTALHYTDLPAGK